MKHLKRLILLIVILLFIVGSVVLFNGYKMYSDAIHKISLQDRIAEIRNDENYISLGDVPVNFKTAVISVEDHRFTNHNGIDIISIGRAIVSNIKSRSFVEGGSTITQQVGKNIYFIYEDQEVLRKIAEIFLAFDLEKNYSKDEIFELYMNTIYFGDGYYGIKEACKGYLKKEPKDMTLYECTMMAGIPNAPSAYAPTANFALTKKRQEKVIRSMVEYGGLSKNDADAMIKQNETATYPF